VAPDQQVVELRPILRDHPPVGCAVSPENIEWIVTVDIGSWFLVDGLLKLILGG
jgi:hypothetical protein